MISLRPYQETLVASVRSAFASGHRCVMAQAPVGAGKTVCFSYVAHGAYTKGKRVLALVHRVEILDQISATFTAAGVPHSVLARGAKVTPSQVTVASIQTLARRQIEAPDLIIADEAHHLASKTYTNVLERWPNAKVLSVTATPERLSGEALRPWADTLILGPSVSWLIANGFLVKPRYWAPTGPSMAGVRRKMGDFDQAEVERRMSTAKITGDAVAEYTKHAAGKRAIVFCCSVKHAHEVADAFTSAGFKAECIHAETTDRVAMMQRFRDGATTVLVNVDLLGEGVDVPAVEAVVLLRPTQSLTLHIQQIGRALRPADGKQFAVVIDHCGNLERLGAVEQDREWNLDGHAAKRGTVVALSRCPTCFYMGPPFDACPECGAVRDAKPRVLKMGRGELEEWVPNTPGEQAVREMELARRDAQQKNILLARFKDKGIPHERALAIAEAVVRKQRKKREAA